MVGLKKSWHLRTVHRRRVLSQLADDYQKMAEFLLPYAQSVIDSGQHLAPVGSAIGSDGSPQAVFAMPDSSPVGDPQEMERMLISTLREKVKSGEYRSTGIALEMHEIRLEGRPSMPAIKLILETNTGVAASYYQPFQRRLFQKPRYHEKFMIPGTAVVFDDSLDIS